MDGLFEHDVLDDLLLADVQFLGLLGDLLVDSGRADEGGQTTWPGRRTGALLATTLRDRPGRASAVTLGAFSREASLEWTKPM